MKTTRRGFFKVATAATVSVAAAVKAEPKLEAVKPDAKFYRFSTIDTVDWATSASIAGHATSASCAFLFAPKEKG